MKTYLFDTINRYKRFSEKLDVQTAICNKSWWVFNDSGEKELYIFNEDGTLDVSFGGRVTEGKWRYVSANKSIIVSANSESFMLDPAFIDNVIFALKLNGTDQYVFMIDENNTASFAPSTYKELMGYFDEKLNRVIAIEEAKVRKIEEERIKSEEKKLELYYQQKWIREKLPREVYERYRRNYRRSFMLPIIVVIISFFVWEFWTENDVVASVLFLFMFPFSMVFIAVLYYVDKCYKFLKNIRKNDESFNSEWDVSWEKNWAENFELYENNVDLEEIKKMCLKEKI
jgi:hypothetical protein